MIALYLTLRNVFLVLLAIPCVILCEICFCPPVCLFVILLPLYASKYLYWFYANKLHYNLQCFQGTVYTCKSNISKTVRFRDKVAKEH